MQEGFVQGGAAPDETRRVTREERRNTGMYYTPVAIARYVVRKAMERWLPLARQGKRSVTILDPACGDGIFLVETIRSLFGGGSSSHVIEHLEARIHGIDIDDVALRAAKVSMIHAMEESKIPRDEDHVQLFKHNALEVITDGLSSKILEVGGFDIVIGNPPYIPWNRIPRADRMMLEAGQFLDVKYQCRPNHADAQPNCYLFFIVVASSLVNENGVISFLLPQEWLYHERAIDFRRYLLDHFQTIDVALFPPTARIFSQKGVSAGTTSMVLTLGKRGSGEVTMHRIDELPALQDAKLGVNPPGFQAVRLSFGTARDNAWVIVDEKALAIKDAILRQPVAFFNDAGEFAVHGGFQPPVVAARGFELDEKAYARLTPVERTLVFRLVLDAREIRRYAIVPREPRYWIVANNIPSESELEASCPNLYAILKSRLDATKPGWWHFPNVRNFDVVTNTPEKLLAPRTAAEPCFALDDRRSVFKGTNTMIIPKKLDPRYVVGVLNSKLAAFWQETFGFGYHGGIVKKLEPSKARKTLLPIKVPSVKERDGLIELVNMMIGQVEARAGAPAIASIQQRIDAAVYALYGIDGKMKEFIDTKNHTR